VGFSRNASILRPSSAGVDHAERAGLAARHRDTGDGQPGAPVEVLLPHLAGVHPVDVVRTEDDDQVRALVVDQVQRLEDRVCRPRVPARAEPLLRGHGRDVVAQQVRQAPGHGDVPVEAVALVLGEYGDPQDVRVHQVGQREVDQPVETGEGHGGLRPVVGQRGEPLALTAGQDDAQDSRFGHLHSFERHRPGAPGARVVLGPSLPRIAVLRSVGERRSRWPVARVVQTLSSPGRHPIACPFTGSRSSPPPAGLLDCAPRRPVCGNRPSAPYESKR